MSKRSEIRIALEKFFRAGDAKVAGAMVRDHRRRPILIPDALIDYDRIGKSGRSFLEMGRRLRILREGGKGGAEVWVLPTELCQISRDEPAAAAGIPLPFGTIVNDRGLWLRWAPGYSEVGVNDRGDVIVRFDTEAAANPELGAVPNSVNTLVQGRSKRLVVRQTADEQSKDRREAEAWLKTMVSAGMGKTLKTDFKCAGIDCVHLTNNPHLHRTSRLGFYDVRDSEMLRLESLVRLRFRKARRQVPSVTVFSLTGIPHSQSEWAAFAKKLKAAKKDPVKMGLPEKLSDSRFYDPASKGIVPASFVPCSPLAKLSGDLTVVTVNTDWHGEIKKRGVMSPITSIMSLIDVISSSSAVAVLSRSGNAVCFTGPSGTGKSVAALFWSDRNEKHRRQELRRRYEMDIRRTPDAGRLGEAGIQKELDRTMAAVGILCQEDGVEILKEGAGRWVFWPAFRALYARTAGFPGLRYVLAENQPLLENAAADLGGSGDPRGLGRMNHACYTERVFYDPEWHHLNYDRTPRMISAHLLLDRAPELGFLVRRATAREALDWLLQGRCPDGSFEPLCQPGADFSGLLMQLGVTGESLGSAYESARRGDYAPLGAGDPNLGQAIYEKMDAQVKLWLDSCREVPTFIVNESEGIELAQDAHWLLSEHPELFNGWHLVSVEEFRKYMAERYGVTYGTQGEWTHISFPAGRD